jgi:hypothetical protein
MALSRRGLATTAGLSLLLLLGLSGCTAPTTETDAARTPSTSPSPSPSPTPRPTPTPTPTPTRPPTTDDREKDDQTGTDGPADPAQGRVRVGPAVDYGGPANGDQGATELIAGGLWCETVLVFWGGEQGSVPAGVRFTFESAVPDQPGLQVKGGGCGSEAPDTSCVGLTMGADASQILCSLTLLPGPDFVDGTRISFNGRLECPTAEVCKAVASRVVERGPPITVNRPAGEEAEEEQQQENQQQENQQQEEEPTQPPQNPTEG